MTLIIFKTSAIITIFLRRFKVLQHTHFCCHNTQYRKPSCVIQSFVKQHAYQQLTDEQVTYLAGLTNTTHLNEVLDNICVPRVVGTKGHTAVHNYIVGQLEQLGWNVEIDSFKERTPIFGVLNFRNIIATLNTQADRYLVLACHYDSKFFPNFEFEGATDSAVPCAMMLNLAKVMRKELNNDNDPHLKLIFFDGEEAFKQWNKKDSIYGARHLAATYADKVITTRSGFSVNELSKMDLFVLLDLIGGPNPSFLNHFSRTTRWHMRMVEIEERLSDFGLLANSGSYFKSVDNNLNIIEDDHIPFLARGVPILHIIATPFPKVWHTIGDNREFVDLPTVEHINQILRVFVAEYLHLDIEESPYDEDTFREEL